MYWQMRKDMFQLSLSDGYQRPVSIADSLLALSDACFCDENTP